MDHKPENEITHHFLCSYGTGEIIFFYAGYFSQTLIAAMAEAVKLRIEHLGAGGLTRRKLFSSFIEMAQNIIHYSADFHEQFGAADHAMRHGSVCISSLGERFFLHCANPVKSEVADHLRKRLNHLSMLNNDQIKTEYKEVLRMETAEPSKGAGLGLLTMARDASAPLAFEFSPSGAMGNFLFCLKATI